MLLLIPGPVTTHPEVRAAMCQDFAPWDNDFRPLYAGIRERLLRIAMAFPASTQRCRCKAAATSSPRQRSARLSRRASKLLIPATGAYADRMIRLACEAGRVPVPLPISPVAANRPPDAVAAALTADPTSAMSALCIRKPAAASCTTLPRSARWCARPDAG